MIQLKLSRSICGAFDSRQMELGSTVEKANLLSADQIQDDKQQRPIVHELRARCVKAVLKTIFVLSYCILLWLYLRAARTDPDSRGLLFLGNERIYDDAPTALKTYAFQVAGFHRRNSTSKTAFEGRPSKQNNAAWQHALNVGVIAITTEENGRFPDGGSATVRNDPDHHVAVLAVFHQLHCLKYLRDLIYDFDDGAIVPGAQSEYQIMHGDHCIDYLRQVLMCHGDLTPIKQSWQPDLHAYAADQKPVHQCRDFDKIWDWAAERNTTGLRADGKHEGIDTNSMIPPR